MSAPDPLLRLSLEALTQLTNVGLVKRAQRELLSSAPPILTRGADGGLHAEFADGVRTEFAAGAGVVDARCSCGAALCRHRLMAVLSWQAQQDASALAPVPALSPGAVDDQRLQAWAGAKAWAQAGRLRAQGLLVDVRRPGPDDPVPSARLPHATVRFHGGDDPATAQSDATPVDHKACVVLGAWAFRVADAEDAQVPLLRVQLGARVVSVAALTPALQELAAGLLRHGLGGGHERHALALSSALEAARNSGATWVLLALLELEQWLESYALRSAAFSADHGVRLLAELLARARAGRGLGELAAQFALGIGERFETPLARIRLRALGLRIHGDGEARSAQLALFDPDTQSSSALVCRWDNAKAKDAAAVARAGAVRVGGSASLDALARGQLVSVNVHRRADGELRLGAGHGGRTSVMAQSADWSELPSAICIDRLSTWRERQTHLPPTMLQPRQVLGQHLLFRPTEIGEIGFDPASETIYAALVDADGDSVVLTRSYERHAPGALDALARALGSPSKPLFIAGVLRLHGALPKLDPWALSDGQQLIIPDLATPDGAIRDLPLGTLPQLRDPLPAALAQAQDWICLRLLGGAGAVGWNQRRKELIHTLERVGLSDLAQAAQALASTLEESPNDTEQSSDRLADLLIPLVLSQTCGK